MKQAVKPPGDVKAILDRMDDYHLPPERYLNRTFGRGAWRYDPYTGYYIVPDDEYTGPGRGFIILDRQLNSQEWVLPAHQVI